MPRAAWAAAPRVGPRHEHATDRPRARAPAWPAPHAAAAGSGPHTLPGARAADARLTSIWRPSTRGLQLEVGHGIDGCAVEAHLEVQVRAG